MRGEIARGAAWMVLFRLFDRSIGIVSTAVLARLLLPADFGLVAMAMSIIAVVELATSFSFEIALIQKADPERSHYDTAWTLNLVFSSLAALVIAALAFPAAAFYDDARLTPVMFAIAGTLLIAGLENIGTVNFRREMNFSGEFRMMAIRRVIGFAVTMIAAFTLRSYWALIIGTASVRFAGVVLSYLMQPYRPRLSLARMRELFSFSGWMLANNIVGVVLGKVPHFAVGRLFGAQSLGAYTVGAEIAHLAYTELVAPINRATFPGYSRLVDDPPAFRRTCLDATAAILLIVLPVTVAVAVLAGPIVRVLLGPQWVEAVAVIQLLVVSGAVSAVTSNNVAAYLALGRPYLPTVILATRLVMTFGGIALLWSPHGLLGVAMAELLASLGSLLVSLPILFRMLHISTLGYIGHLWRPLVASVLTGGVVHAVLRLMPAADSFVHALLQLAVAVPVGAVAYPLLVAGLWVLSGRPQTLEVLVANRAGQWLRKRFGRAA